MKTILGDFKRALTQLGDLLNLGLSGRFEPAIVAMRAMRWMRLLDAINLIRSKRGAIDALMAGLTALLVETFGRC